MPGKFFKDGVACRIHGCRWFHDTLDDADLSINSMMWQNAGKAGLDGWNFTVSPVSGTQAGAHSLSLCQLAMSLTIYRCRVAPGLPGNMLACCAHNRHMAPALQLHIMQAFKKKCSTIPVMRLLRACTAWLTAPWLSHLTHCAWLKAVLHHHTACVFRFSAWAQDPGGEYVATWVPELKGLPKRFLHKPWEAPAEALQAAGVELGQTYPHRIETQRLEVKRTLSGCLAKKPGVHACMSTCWLASSLIQQGCKGVCLARVPNTVCSTVDVSGQGLCRRTACCKAVWDAVPACLPACELANSKECAGVAA